MARSPTLTAIKMEDMRATSESEQLKRVSSARQLGSPCREKPAEVVQDVSPGSGFRHAHLGGDPRADPRTHWGDYMSRLARGLCCVPPEEFVEAAGEESFLVSLLKPLSPQPGPR